MHLLLSVYQQIIVLSKATTFDFTDRFLIKWRPRFFEIHIKVLILWKNSRFQQGFLTKTKKWNTEKKNKLCKRIQKNIFFCTSATSTEKWIMLQINLKKKFKTYHYTLNLWRNHHQKESCKRAIEASERKWVLQILRTFSYGKKRQMGIKLKYIIRR